MERVFSVEEISDPFWAPTPGPPPPALVAALNKSSSEWCFEKFLEEASVPQPSPAHPLPPPASSPLASVASNYPSSSISAVKLGDEDVVEIKRPAAGAVSSDLAPDVDPRQVAAILRQKLDSICAAVAMSRVSGVLPQELSSLADSKVACDLDSSEMVSQPSSGGGGQTGTPPLPNVQISVVQAKPATSGSEQSDDDEVEGEAENTENLDPTDAKRVRRMLSNRESARRSRRRKQAHLTELEVQVSQLRVENSSLLKRLTDVNQKYTEAAVGNRVLKADVETLRAKVKMAEETVKRVTGLNPNPYPPISGISELTSITMPFKGSPSDGTSDAAVAFQDDPSHFLPILPHHQQMNPSVSDFHPTAPQVENVHGAVAGERMGRAAASMQQVASLEHLQKQIRGGVGPSGSVQWDGAGRWEPQPTICNKQI